MANMTATIGRPPVIVHFGENTAEAMRQASIANSAAEASELSAAYAESMTGPTYADTSAGLAATTDGQGFAVDNGDGTVTVYQNDSGSAVEQRTLATTAALASSTGTTMVGVGNDRTQADVNAEVVSVFDYIPAVAIPAIIARTSTFDCTTYIHAARDAVKGTGKTLRFPGGTYYVGNVVWDGTGYRVETAPGVEFQQKPGLTTDGGGEYSPIWNVTGTGITFGDVHFIGNIATDFGQSSHAIALTSAKNCSFGTITAEDVRGDVVYAYGRTTSEAERCYGNTFTSISGTNVYRNRIGMSGGEIFVQNMPASGPYGYRDIHLEPNAEGSYQEPILRFGSGLLGVAECVSNDDVDKTAAFIGDYLDLDLDRVQDSTPPFDEDSTGPGTNSYALSLGACRSVNIRYLKLRNYNYSPISFGAGWEHLEIGVLDAANCALTVSEKCLIRQDGDAGTGKVSIGQITWPDGSNKWIARVEQSGLMNFNLSGGTMQGYIGTGLTGSVSLDSIDLDDQADAMLSGCDGLRVRLLNVSGEGNAIGVYASNNIKFVDTSATFGTAVHATSTKVFSENSAINGASADGINFLTTDGVIRVGGVKVLGAQGAAVADASGGSTVDTEARAAINALLARARSQGWIAT